MNIGFTLQKLRKNHNIRQNELADLIGVTQTYISLIEKGKKIPSIPVLLKISDVFLTPFPVLLMLALEDRDIHHTKIDTYIMYRNQLNELIKKTFKL